MATQVPKPLIMVFEKDQGVNFKEVRHYKLIEGTSLLSEKVNISKLSPEQRKLLFNTINSLA